MFPAPAFPRVRHSGRMKMQSEGSKKNRKKQLYGCLLIALAAFCYSWQSPITKLLLAEGVRALDVVTGLSLCSAVLIDGFFLATRKARGIVQEVRENISVVFLQGLAKFGINFGLFLALRTMNAGVLSVVYYTAPAFVCVFFMITKRPERIADHLPPDWGGGWAHVTIAVTCENAEMAEKRLPVYLSLPLCRHAVMIEPMLSAVDLRPYFRAYPGVIRSVSVGGESGPDARLCDFAWVLDVYAQCRENGAAFSYHQTGARLLKDGREYRIPRKHQHSQARRAGLELPAAD